MNPTPRARSETFHWTFDGARDRIWAALADTERFNEAAGLPRYDIEEREDADGRIRFFAEANVKGVQMAWEELPTNWVRHSWFSHARVFSKGPLATLTAELKLQDREQGSEGIYTLTASPRTLFGRVLLGTGFFPSARRDFTTLAGQADRFATGMAPDVFDVPDIALDPEAEAYLAALAKPATSGTTDEALRRQLIEHVRTAGEIDVRRLRPLALAGAWGADEQAMITASFEGVRDGLLAATWDLLCPRCQGAKVSSDSLDALPTEAHCASCNITYGRDFAKNVELTFYPNRRIRDVPDGEFCLYGPMTTPHVHAQLTVPPRSSRSVDLSELPTSRLRLRLLEAAAESEARFASEPNAGPIIRMTPESIDVVERSASAVRDGDRTAQLINDSDRLLTLVIDTPHWSRDALTADRVFAMQSFRDIFSDALLRPGDHLAIDHAVIVFIDLKGSTRLYEEIGDAEAYRLVREFFAQIAGDARRHGGAVVKTIGDAVNLAFTNPASALRCARDIHHAFDAHNAALPTEAPRTECKTGIHVCRTIAVTLNGRLDYYGTGVNLAARLCDCAEPGEIAISDEMCGAPGVADVVAGCEPKRELRDLKGFDQAVAVTRLKM